MKLLTKRFPILINQQAPVNVPFDLYKIHDGGNDSKYISVYHEASAVASGTNFHVLAVVPSGYVLHVRAGLVAEEMFRLRLYEGTTTSSDGSGITGINMNRQDQVTVNSDWYHTPSISSPGNTLIRVYHPANDIIINLLGLGNYAQFVLKENTKYLFRMTNKGGSAADLIFVANFWEEAV